MILTVAIIALLIAVLIGATSVNAVAATFTQKDNEAKEEIISSLSKAVNSQYSQYKTITATTHDNQTILIYNQSQAPPPPPPTCPPNTVYNETSKTCAPIPPKPPVCPPGQHWNQTAGECRDDTVPIPNPPPTTDKPAVNFNTSKYLRVATVGDIDNNNGLVTQLNLAKKYHTQVLIVVGDYGYSSCPGVIDKIKAAGFTKDNAIIVQGNHDCSANTKAFNGLSQLYGLTSFRDGKLAVLSIDGNSGFSCTSAQYTDLKAKLASSDAWYNIPAIHQPFVTVKSDHSANGQFNCWNPLFKAEKIGLVLQAHNHLYMKDDVNGIKYMIVGTGTHDTGSSMYPCGSTKDQLGNPALCITGTNGITLLDLRIDDPQIRSMQGYFISNSDKIVDRFDQ